MSDFITKCFKAKLFQQIFARLVHLFKSMSLLAALGDIFLCLFAGKFLAFRTEIYVLFLAAFSYLAVFSEFVAVGGNCAAAAAGDVLGVKLSFAVGKFKSEKSSHTLVVPLGGDVNETFVAHYSAAGNCFHILFYPFSSNALPNCRAFLFYHIKPIPSTVKIFP